MLVVFSYEYLHTFLINFAVFKSVNRMVGCRRVCHFLFPAGTIEFVSSPFFPEWFWGPPSLLCKEYRGFLFFWVVKTVWACSWLFTSHMMPKWMLEERLCSLNIGTPFHSRCFNTTLWLLTRNECGERRECWYEVITVITITTSVQFIFSQTLSIIEYNVMCML